MTPKLGQTYRTKSGRRVRIVAVDRVGPQPIVGLYAPAGSDRVEATAYYNANGTYLTQGGSDHDLLPQTRVGYVNLIHVFSSVQAARDDARGTMYNIVQVTYEDE